MHWLGRHRRLILAGICLFWSGLVLPLHFLPSLPFVSAVWTGQTRFEDFLQKEGRKTPTRDDFVFLGIDQSTLQLPSFEPAELAENRALQLMTERSFPWSREVWALVLDRLFASGARLVLVDLISIRLTTAIRPSTKHSIATATKLCSGRTSTRPMPCKRSCLTKSSFPHPRWPIRGLVTSTSSPIRSINSLVAFTTR